MRYDFSETSPIHVVYKRIKKVQHPTRLRDRTASRPDDRRRKNLRRGNALAATVGHDDEHDDDDGRVTR